jgi:FMN phosphatase YigB (HAD superfamily)
MRTNGHGKPVVALDIDGTLGDYHAHFLRFAEGWIGKPMPDPEEINPGDRLHKFMGVPLRVYRECKLAYRQGGLKRNMPVYEGAQALTSFIRKDLKAEVWICTTRPYLRLDNIDPDTQEWLRRNRIRYDAVLYGEDKYRELKRQAGDRVASVIDDLPEMVREAARLFPDRVPILRTQPYNVHMDWPRRAGSLNYAAGMIMRDIDGWKGPR